MPLLWLLDISETDTVIEIQNNKIHIYTVKRSEAIPFDDGAATRLQAAPQGFFFLVKMYK